VKQIGEICVLSHDIPHSLISMYLGAEYDKSFAFYRNQSKITEIHRKPQLHKYYCNTSNFFNKTFNVKML